MNRGSSSKYVHRLIEQFKKKVPGITLRTTFIVGHPGETDQDFEELKNFIHDTEFDRVGVFKFSPEEGTPSFDMKGLVDESLKTSRLAEIMSLQQKISLKKNKNLVGKTIRAIYEGPSEQSEYFGTARHQGMAPDIDGEILIRDGEANLGKFCQVKIVDAFEYDLLGEIVL